MELEPGMDSTNTPSRRLDATRRRCPGSPRPTAFLVFGADASVLIDSGWENEDDHRARVTRFPDYLREVNAPPVAEIIITHRHPDHGGGALHMHRHTGAPLACHPSDRGVPQQNDHRARPTSTAEAKTSPSNCVLKAGNGATSGDLATTTSSRRCTPPATRSAALRCTSPSAARCSRRTR